MDFNAGAANGFVATMLVYVATLLLTCVSLGSVMALSQHWLCLCSFWPLKLYCCDKVANCHNILAVKPGKNSIFLKKGKTVISVGN